MEYHSGGSLPLLGRPRYCPGANANGGYLCETGHCCGETGCCTYYYELWWFWLLWTVLILFSCCCAYRHRRAKLRVQQQQRQREISLLAYHGANSYPSSMLDLSFLASLKLPSYEEVAAQPSTPPPPYSSVFTTPRYPQPPRAADPHLLTQHGPLLHRPLSDGPSSLSSDNSSSLSAPVTYETDTSHATTPSEATPLTLDVTMETIAAAASCLEVNEAQFVSERKLTTVDIGTADENSAGAQEHIATDSAVTNQIVSMGVVTRAVSPHSLPSPSSEVALPIVTTSPVKQQLGLIPCTSIVNTCSFNPSTYKPYPSFNPTTYKPYPSINPTTYKPYPSFNPSTYKPYPSFNPSTYKPYPSFNPSTYKPYPSFNPSTYKPYPSINPTTYKPYPSINPTTYKPYPSINPTTYKPYPSINPTTYKPYPSINPTTYKPYPGFDPGPPSWEDEEEQQEQDDDEDDMGADESQYRHRRLTGDSGIEVCRCRVEEEEEEEEGEEKEEEKRKEISRRGGGGVERDKKVGGNTDLHDSVDCPARGQITTGEGLTLCNSTSTTSPASEDGGKVLIVMETV
ncbi:WW domain-binding protein 1 [Nibea albiflora]|uniref:WW domain-binding protein 1 n=1 Tax=Nibea albiflora TaxID=240163 RepID=A0ACB7EUH4_NIBAL|nr:WW domain-binding protein 1 [Nibea albiflora]